ncbi:GH1 family beta-glucosidase [Paenarthrobacter sp. NPDC091711]|uniref:GH1 family beta-glucosidase n=1 Tax=Paenarthrobacter sp. NPDC091711 TaxID=3364385 RepID=UPI0038177F67
MTFPSTFRWGTATSAYQIEGATAEDGRGPTDWDSFASQPGTIHRGDTADIAVDHYHRFAEDFDLLSELNVDTYRLSISWTRVIPDGIGDVNEAGLAYYSRLIDALKSRGITPMVTLNHMELPLPLAERGGWLNRDTIDAYVRYVRVVHARLQDRVSLWSTMNEVGLTAWFGVGTSYFPPALNDQLLVLPAIHNQMVAHGRAITLMRASQPDGEFGIVGSYWPFQPFAPGAENEKAVGHLDLVINRSCMDVLVHGEYPAELIEWHNGIGGKPFIQDGDLHDAAAQLDYYGLNYYAPLYVVADQNGPGGPGVPPGLGVRQEIPSEYATTAFGWPIVPDGLLPVLKLFRDRYKLPVYITENGGAFHDYIAPNGVINDGERIDYISRHLDVVAEAIDEGVEVRGYMAWSLLDNFEWAEGFSKRFGLVYVDYSTQKRTPKQSFRWYAERIRQAREAALPVNHKG